MRVASAGLATASVLFLGMYCAGAVGLRGTEGRRSQPKEGGLPPAYHAPVPGTVPAKGSCGSADCHPADPHKARGPVSAFLNFHGEFTDCTVCHGLDAVSWEVRSRAEGGSWVLASRGPLPPGDPHGKLSAPRGCRQCHSASGMEELGTRGMKEFPRGFESPIALRMIEESRTRWLPAGLR